jgi:hypothetical protein
MAPLLLTEDLKLQPSNEYLERLPFIHMNNGAAVDVRAFTVHKVTKVDLQKSQILH